MFINFVLTIELKNKKYDLLYIRELIYLSSLYKLKPYSKKQNIKRETFKFGLVWQKPLKNLFVKTPNQNLV